MKVSALKTFVGYRVLPDKLVNILVNIPELLRKESSLIESLYATASPHYSITHNRPRSHGPHKDKVKNSYTFSLISSD